MGSAGTSPYATGFRPAAGVGYTRARWPIPNPRYADLAGHYALYPQKLDACWVDNELVDANEGWFYGGWITSNVRGPFKGGPGSARW
ncbi:MAG: hypothetical protein ACFCVK_03720 [Acidimicrobiales bacterium]